MLCIMNMNDGVVVLLLCVFEVYCNMFRDA